MNRDEVILALLDAAVDPTAWSNALQCLARWTSVRSINLDAYDLRHSRGNVSVAVGVDARYVEAYNSEAVAPNPLVEAARGRVATGDIRTVTDLVRWRDYESSELFQMLLKPSGHRHVAGIAVEVSAEAIAHVSFNKSDDAGEFSECELARLSDIQPWISRAYGIHRRLAATGARVAELSSLWDRVDHAVFLLDRNGQIRFANRAAESLLRWRIGLSEDNGRLVPVHPRARAVLKRALAAAAPLAQGATLFRLPRSPGQAALQATLFPHDDQTIGLLVSDPEAPLPLSVERLRGLFELTPAQARLVLALVQGQSLREHAEAELIGYETARTHLKHAMARNAWRRQGEMIAAVIRSALPLR